MRWSLVQECLTTADFSGSAFSQLVLCSLRRDERFQPVSPIYTKPHSMVYRYKLAFRYTILVKTNCFDLSAHIRIALMNFRNPVCTQWRRQVSEFGGRTFEGQHAFWGEGQHRISRNLPSPSLPKFSTPWIFFHNVV